MIWGNFALSDKIEHLVFDIFFLPGQNLAVNLLAEVFGTEEAASEVTPEEGAAR